MKWDELYRKYGITTPKSSKKNWSIILIAVIFICVSLTTVLTYYIQQSVSKCGKADNLCPKNCNYSLDADCAKSIISNSPNATTLTTTIITDSVKKCMNAGGECKTNCASEVTASTSGGFFEGIVSWFANLFSSTESSSTLGSTVSSSNSQEIGSYPDYCTQQLPKCCKKTSTTVTNTAQSSTIQPYTTSISATTSTVVANSSATNTTVVLDDQVSNSIGDELDKATANITNDDIWNLINS